MAIKKFIFLNTTDGFQEEQGASDGAKLYSLVLGAGAESAGNIQLSTTGKVVGLANGTDAADAINKAQLDAAIAGYRWKSPVQVLKMKSDAARTAEGAIVVGSGGTGINLLTTGNSFSVSINGETAVPIILVSAPADRAAAITAINTLYGTGGGLGGTIAVAGAADQIDIKSNTTGTGSTVAITSAHANWLEVGIVNATDAGTNDLPTVGAAGEAWLVNNWGTGYTNGNIVEWDGAAWNIVLANSGGEPPNATHVLVIGTGAAGSFASQGNKFATYNSTANTWSFVTPLDGDATLVNGELSIYENYGFVYDTSGWVQFTGPASIPDATGASSGGIKGKATFDTDKGFAVTTGIVTAKLEAAGTGTGGLAFNGSGAFKVNLNASSGLALSSNGLAANPDGTTLWIDGTNKLAVLGTPESQRVAFDFTAGIGGITAKYPVYVSADDTVLMCDAGNDAKVRVIGLAPAPITATEEGEVIFSGYAAGVLTGADPGVAYYLADGGGLTAVMPGASKHIIRMGYSCNETDLCVQITYLGKRASS